MIAYIANTNNNSIYHTREHFSDQTKWRTLPATTTEEDLERYGFKHCVACKDNDNLDQIRNDIFNQESFLNMAREYVEAGYIIQVHMPPKPNRSTIRKLWDSREHLSL